MKRLEITQITPSEESTTISWHRFNDDDSNQDDKGEWTVGGDLTPDEVIEYAKTMVDSDIEVSLNLQ